MAQFDLGMDALSKKLRRCMNAAQEGKIHQDALEYLGERAVGYARALTPEEERKVRDGWGYEADGSTIRLVNYDENAVGINNGRRMDGGFVPGQHQLEKAMTLVRNNDLNQAQKLVLEALRKELE